jgi:hypothetical protein
MEIVAGQLPAAIAIYNWTGFYIGAHGGGAWAHTPM